MTKYKYLFTFDFFFCNPTPFLACWIMIVPIPSSSFVTSTHALCSCEKLGWFSLANRLHSCLFQLSMTHWKKSINLKLNIAMAKSGGCIKWRRHLQTHAKKHKTQNLTLTLHSTSMGTLKRYEPKFLVNTL
jgi:hypothetical protein